MAPMMPLPVEPPDVDREDVRDCPDPLLDNCDSNFFKKRMRARLPAPADLSFRPTATLTARARRGGETDRPNGRNNSASRLFRTGIALPRSAL